MPREMNHRPQPNDSRANRGDGPNHGDHHAHMVADFRRRFFVSLALSVPIVLLAPLVQGLLGVRRQWDFPGDAYVQFGLATVVFFYGGRPFLTGLADELKKKTPGMMTLIGVAVIVAYTYSSAVVFGLPGKVFFWELATLIAIMLLGHWIEMRSVMGASGALEELVRLIPSTAQRVTADGGTEEVAVSELAAGDRVAVRPGEKVPVDGVVVEGRSQIDESLVTGESRQVEKGEGDEVIGGSVNGASALTVEVRKTGRDTYLSRVADMVRRARESDSKAQNTADRAAFWLTVVALTAGGLTLAGWLTAGRPFVFSLERMVTVMVITCPHALGLAVPLVVAVSTTLAARRGLLIRDRTAFEQARHLDAVVFDKTGTLTEGRFAVTEIVPLDGDAPEDEVLRLAAALESRSEHAIARGIVAAAEEKGIDPPSPKDFEAIPGKGARARVDGRDVKVVSPGYLDENGIAAENETVRGLTGEGKTVVYLLVDDAPQGALALDDQVRPTAAEGVSRLQGMGLKVLMFTGDAEAVARRVADKLGLDDFIAEVLPDEKADRIRRLREEGRRVAMVGDGVNDAPALAAADAGIAIGAGTDVAMEAADIVLVRSDPRDVAGVMALSGATHTKTVQNLWWAAGYNIVAIPLAAGVLYPLWQFLLPPAVGALVMSLSTVIVAVNARLLSPPGEPG
jgi:P-type Cu2+ transporter